MRLVLRLLRQRWRSRQTGKPAGEESVRIFAGPKALLK